MASRKRPPYSAPGERPVPSLARVALTTLRLRLQRWRVAARWRARRAVPSAIGALVLLIVGIGAAALWGKDSGKDSARRAAPAAAPPDRVHQAVASNDAESARSQAVRWTTAQVGPDVVVACDPVLCGALSAAGRPRASTVTIRAADGDLLQADLVLVTEVIKSRYGTGLAAITAPDPLADIGQGDGRIEVRAVATDGAANYRRRLAADVAERRRSGGELAGSGRLDLSRPARAQLASGSVDLRLMSALASLSSDFNLGVVAFADGAPSPPTGGDADTVVPYRTAQIDAIDGAVPDGDKPRTAAVIRFLHAQDPPYHPLSVDVIRPPDLMRPVLQIRFSAPSPLGL
ncbi:MAG TPA: hypothetical protein VH912_23700 [Streptosporangiaceae bacterium]